MLELAWEQLLYSTTSSQQHHTQLHIQLYLDGPSTLMYYCQIHRLLVSSKEP